MMNLLTSPDGFLLLLAFFGVGTVGSLLAHKNDTLANAIASTFAIVGSLWGLLLGIATVFSVSPTTFTLPSLPAFPLFSLSFHLDPLAGFFIATISLIALLSSIYGTGYVKQYYGVYSLSALGAFFHLFVGSMFLVVSAGNGLFFLLAWELMAITSYFLVVYDRAQEDNVKAGFLYLLMTHVGTAFLILAFLLMFHATGSFAFGDIQAGAGAFPLWLKNSVFLLALVGLGTKAGIIPFHIWLPSAHPAAPSHISAIMSGVMIKTGIYMMIRLFLDLLAPVPAWWGPTILAVGSVSALLGVLYALTEHDLKRLLAYHSIENIGIILLGFGSALTFAALGMPSLALLGLAAALFHTLNHAIFKSLLFLSAGSVIHATHTRNMEEYGGLIRFMPQTAFFFLVGSMAISALPPFNGFFSEWLTFQSLFQGIALLGSGTKWIFIIAAGALAFTGGLALACFVKAFGATFLARPRSPEVHHAKEAGMALRLGMGVLAGLCLLLGVFSGSITRTLESVAGSLSLFQATMPATSISAAQQMVVGDDFASVSAPMFLIALLIALVIIACLTRLIYPKQKVSVGATWDCGVDLTPRMEITATGFARSIILIFKGILKPSMQHAITYEDAQSRYLPTSRTVTLATRDVHQSYFYEPLRALLAVLARGAKRIQGGNVSAYLLYLLIALGALLAFAL